MTPREHAHRAAGTIGDQYLTTISGRLSMDAVDVIQAAIEAAVADEREACANLVDDWHSGDFETVEAQDELAAAIRARGTNTGR